MMEWVYTEDEYGIYGKLMDGDVVVAESTKYKDKWHEENPPEPEVLPEPTETEMMMDYLVDVDYRVTMIELGL